MASRTLHGRAVDLGASYLTVSGGSPFAAVVGDWVARGLARPWTDTFAVAGPDGLRGRTSGPVRYAAPGGLRTLVTDLATGLDVVAERTVARVAAGPRVDGEEVAAAVLALPDPQARRLLEPGLADRLLGQREWLPTLAVVLGWPARQWPADLHGAFVQEDPVVEWVADDGDRRGDGAAVLVAHTTPGFAAGHLADPEAAVGAVAAAVGRALGIASPPEWTHAHRWTFAKPADPRPEPFGLVDGIGACGDGWSAPSKVQSAWASGNALGRALAG
jgi:predicted NAD/FAD-dependent oxidoreductase